LASFRDTFTKRKTLLYAFLVMVYLSPSNDDYNTRILQDWIWLRLDVLMPISLCAGVTHQHRGDRYVSLLSLPVWLSPTIVCLVMKYITFASDPQAGQAPVGRVNPVPPEAWRLIFSKFLFCHIVQ
jgi:hypothetical protein